MSGQPTRGGLPPVSSNRAIPIPQTWRRWGAFVGRPVLPDRADLSPGPALRTVAPLFALDMLLMAVLLGAVSVAVTVGFDMPDHMLGGLKLEPLLIAFIVIGAPIGEEILFRGWLSGRPGHVGAIMALLMGGGVAMAAGGTAIAGIAVAASVIAALIVVFWFRGRPAMGWFQRRFVWFFWLSALLFAGVHLSNFAAAGPAILPLVLPQFAVALILGYLRVNHGLWSSMLTHILHNAVFIGLVLAGSAAA
jgi:membrane protease YdiL (CAAX protease family)